MAQILWRPRFGTRVHQTASLSSLWQIRNTFATARTTRNESWSSFCSTLWRSITFVVRAGSTSREPRPYLALRGRQTMTPGPPAIAAYESVIDDLLEQFNRGRSFNELFDRIYYRLQGIGPYDRIAVALLHDGGAKLRLIACRSDGPEVLKVGYEDDVAGSTLADLLRTGQPRILNDLPAYLAAKPSS